MMGQFRILFLYLLFVVVSCSSPKLQQSEYLLLDVVKTEGEISDVDQELQPYSDSLVREMNEVIAYADTSFFVERPCGNLNNWVADAVLVNQTKNVRMSVPVICLLNFGGIRSTINKGDITLGDIYKVAPFDNKIVWATLPIEVLPEIATYLTQTGGEPLSGGRLEGGKIHFDSSPVSPKEFVVITVDFLVNGGDKMYFFNKATDITHTDILLRDCLIQEAKTQRQLVNNDTKRIILDIK